IKISSVRISPTAEPQSAAKAYQLPVRRSRGGGGSASSLLHNFLKLRAEHIDASTNPIAAARDVEPVALFTFDSEFIGLSNVGSVRRVSPGLCDDVGETGTKGFPQKRRGNYYLVKTSICLSSTCPVNRSIAITSQ